MRGPSMLTTVAPLRSNIHDNAGHIIAVMETVIDRPRAMDAAPIWPIRPPAHRSTMSWLTRRRGDLSPRLQDCRGPCSRRRQYNRSFVIRQGRSRAPAGPLSGIVCCTSRYPGRQERVKTSCSGIGSFPATTRSSDRIRPLSELVTRV